MAPPFTVVLVHGSYHTPLPYQPFIQSLKESNIETYCPQLPSSSPSLLPTSPVPAEGFPQPADDILLLNDLLQKLIVEQGENVLLIGYASQVQSLQNQLTLHLWIKRVESNYTDRDTDIPQAVSPPPPSPPHPSRKK